jgi:DNA-binding NtrC family response regulator
MEHDRHILIIDDEPNLRLVFRTSLESDGYRVAEAGDGEEALKRLQRFPADVVLLDLLMPGLGGIEILRRIRAAGNSVRVVIITAHGGVPDAVSAMKLGVIDFLSKPITPEALRGVVGKVLRRHSPLGSGLSPVRSSGPRSVAAAPVAVAPAGVDLAWGFGLEFSNWSINPGAE